MGNTLSDTLRQHPKHFDKLFCSLCHAGEESGTLDIMLDRIAKHREAVDSIKRKVKKALTCPITVIVVALVVAWILLNYAVPAYAEIFKSSNSQLPMITQITIDISELTQHFWLYITLLIIALILSLRWAIKRYQKLQFWRDHALLKLPIIGRIITRSALARFATTLETTLAAGMPLIDALKTVSAATGNLKYEKPHYTSKMRLPKGRTMLNAASETVVFPNVMLQMIAVGEEAGKLEEMLDNVAHIYQDEVDTLVANLSSAIEPLIMVILGLIVGFLVISMYTPMFQLGEAL